MTLAKLPGIDVANLRLTGLLLLEARIPQHLILRAEPVLYLIKVLWMLKFLRLFAVCALIPSIVRDTHESQLLPFVSFPLHLLLLLGRVE